MHYMRDYHMHYIICGFICSKKLTYRKCLKEYINVDIDCTEKANRGPNAGEKNRTV